MSHTGLTFQIFLQKLFLFKVLLLLPNFLPEHHFHFCLNFDLNSKFIQSFALNKSNFDFHSNSELIQSFAHFLRLKCNFEIFPGRVLTGWGSG